MERGWTQGVKEWEDSRYEQDVDSDITQFEEQDDSVCSARYGTHAGQHILRTEEDPEDDICRPNHARCSCCA